MDIYRDAGEQDTRKKETELVREKERKERRDG